MIKIKNCAIDMIVALNHTFSHLDSSADINLHMSLDGNDVVIYDSPATRRLRFSDTPKKGVVVNCYQLHTKDHVDSWVATDMKHLSLNNMPEIEHYIIDFFNL